MIVAKLEFLCGDYLSTGSGFHPVQNPFDELFESVPGDCPALTLPSPEDGRRPDQDLPEGGRPPPGDARALSGLLRPARVGSLPKTGRGELPAGSRRARPFLAPHRRSPQSLSGAACAKHDGGGLTTEPPFPAPPADDRSAAGHRRRRIAETCSRDRSRRLEVDRLMDPLETSEVYPVALPVWNPAGEFPEHRIPRALQRRRSLEKKKIRSDWNQMCPRWNKNLSADPLTFLPKHLRLTRREFQECTEGRVALRR